MEFDEPYHVGLMHGLLSSCFALSGLPNNVSIAVNSQGVALGWFVSPFQGLYELSLPLTFLALPWAPFGHDAVDLWVSPVT